MVHRLYSPAAWNVNESGWVIIVWKDSGRGSKEGESLTHGSTKIFLEIVGVISRPSAVLSIVNMCRRNSVSTPFVSFFTSGLESENGEDVSNQVVKKRVKDIIEVEPPLDPLNEW